MAGRLVPLVLFPRYTTFLGQPGGHYATIPIDASDFEKAILTVWRGKCRTGASFAVGFEESMDQNAWTLCTTDPTGGTVEPDEDQEEVVQVFLAKRWFRAYVALGAISDPQVTCWAVGHLERREK